MHKRFLYIDPRVLSEHKSAPGVRAFSRFFPLYGAWVLPVDRTGTIKTPMRTTSRFPMPKFRIFKKSYEQLCNERAKEILEYVEKIDVSLNVLYSGGIDSTCMLISLLKNATPSQKKRIVVLLSPESIMEYPRFYEDYIRGKLRVESSTMFFNFLGKKDFILAAEHNDQLMGSDKSVTLINRCGPSAINAAYRRDTMAEVLGSSVNDAGITDLYLDLFERLCDRCPVPITTNFEFLWWINFALKWQVVAYYSLMFTLPKNRSAKDYIQNNYASFYNTEDFQLWSMNNLDKRIKDTWESYKWVTKEIIYDYTKDADYRDHKTKKGSRDLITSLQNSASFLDEDMNFSDSEPAEAFLEPRNDFIL